MKYFLSFLSGFTAPALFVAFFASMQYGGMVISIFGPWLILFNLALLFLLKYWLKDKFVLSVSLTSLLAPVLTFILLSVAMLNQYGAYSEKTYQFEQTRLTNEFDIQDINCGRIKPIIIRQGQVLECVITSSNELSNSNISGFSMQISTPMDYSNLNQIIPAAVKSDCKISAKTQLTCTFLKYNLPSGKYFIETNKDNIGSTIFSELDIIE